jgi:tartrate dehydratase alpha subunit/fumarate hydratase class I-like protein
MEIILLHRHAASRVLALAVHCRLHDRKSSSHCDSQVKIKEESAEQAQLMRSAFCTLKYMQR